MKKFIAGIEQCRDFANAVRVKAGRSGRAALGKIGRGRTAGDLVAQLLETLTRLALALIDQPDGSLLGRGAGLDGRLFFPDVLIDEIVALVATPRGPSETQGGDWSWT